MKGLYSYLYESALKYPGKTFVQCMGRVWTYNEVDCISQNISELLLEGGVSKGDRIVIFCDNSVQYIAAFFATLRINAVAVPVNPAKMTESVLYIVEKSTPKLILACDLTAGKLENIGGKLCVEIINIDCCNLLDYPRYTGNPYEQQDFEVDESDVAEILFTSGTTANPKGVTLTHGNLIANTEAIMDYLQLTCEDSVLMTLPFTYSYGNSVLLTHAFAGASIIIENVVTFPYRVLEGIKKYSVSGFSTVGSYINLMLKCIKNASSPECFFDNLRYITFAGESTNIDDIQFININYPDIKVYIMYGQTEASARLSYLSPELLNSKIGSIGKGLCNVKLKVVDEADREIEPGEQGEIIAHGPNIMKGYWEDPVATGEVLRDGWLHTGDTATIDEDGFIFIKGRKSDIIKHMGHRISPVEIESVINSCSHIRESAVVESSLDGISSIKAYVVTEKECSVEEIKRFVCARLPIYMRPQIFEIVDQLPRTDSGKIRRNALRRS